MWRRRLRYHLLKFLRLKKSPQSVALGFALGASSNFLPFVGFGGPAAVLMAGLTKANIPASLIGHYLFAPIFPFFFSLDVFIGRFLLKNELSSIDPNVGQGIGFNLHSLTGVGKAFILGAGINFVVFGVIFFIISYKIFVAYRKDLALWLFLRRERRKAMPKDKLPKDYKPPKK